MPRVYYRWIAFFIVFLFIEIGIFKATSIYLENKKNTSIKSPLPKKQKILTTDFIENVEAFTFNSDTEIILVTPTPTFTPTPTPTSTPTPTPSPLPTATPTPLPVTSIEDVFTRYSSEYVVDKDLLKRIAMCESGLNPDAVNGDYLGMYQFATQTWIATRAQMGQDSNPELRKNTEEAIKTAAFKISKGGANAWANCL